MATKPRKPKTVVDEGYSALDMYCIWLHEYHRALRRAGFTNDLSPGYPISWTEILGDIFHPLTSKYRDKILFTIPIPIFKDYS